MGRMKRDTIWLMAATVLFVASLMLFFFSRDRAEYPDRVFPKGGYSATERNFGMKLTPVIISYARKVVDNVRRISSSEKKDRYLYGKLMREISNRYNRKRIPSLFGFLDEEEEGWLLGVFLQAAARVRSRLPRSVYVPDAFLFAAMNNEGRIFADYSDFGRFYDLNGYANAGLDWFSREYLELRRLGYLRPSFAGQFRPSIRTNELKERVPTADFFEVAALFEAFIAVLAHRQVELVADCRRYGIDPGEFEDSVLLFYTYLYYNVGRGFGQRLVRRLGSPAALLDFIHNGPKYPARGNAVTVMTAYEWLDRSGAFDRRPEKRYWWSGGRGLPSGGHPE